MKMELLADHNKLKTDPLASVLISKIQSLEIGKASLYYNFPLYRGETKEDLIQAHVLLVSKEGTSPLWQRCTCLKCNL